MIEFCNDFNETTTNFLIGIPLRCFIKCSIDNDYLILNRLPSDKNYLLSLSLDSNKELILIHSLFDFIIWRTEEFNINLIATTKMIFASLLSWNNLYIIITSKYLKELKLKSLFKKRKIIKKNIILLILNKNNYANISSIKY